MGNILEKVVEKIKTHILCSVISSDNIVIYEIRSKILRRLWGHDVKIWRIRVACWISKATCTYAHVHARIPIFKHACVSTERPIGNIIACPWEREFCERTSVLRYTNIPCLV